MEGQTKKAQGHETGIEPEENAYARDADASRSVHCEKERFAFRGSKTFCETGNICPLTFSAYVGDVVD